MSLKRGSWSPVRRNGWTRTTWSKTASGLVVAVLAAALVLLAVDAQGYPVQHVALNDGGVWVTSDHDGLFGRLNKPAGALDAAFNPPGGAQQDYQLDVVQQGAAVLAWDQAAGKLYPVDVDDAVTLPAQAAPVPAGDQVQLAGGTVAVLDPASGEVWAQRVDTGGGVTALADLGPGGRPVAKIGAGPSQGAALAVGQDGTVYAVGASGEVATVAPAGSTGFAPAVYTKLGRALVAPRLTAVGSQYVLFEPSTGALTVSGGPSITIPHSDAPAQVQASSTAAGAVVVATSHALLSVDLATGKVTTLSQVGQGAPAVPVQFEGCVYAAWADTQDGFVRSCGGPAASGDLTDLQELIQPEFRVNRGEIVLNDLADGGVWDLSDKLRVDDWAAVQPPPIDKPAKNTQDADQDQQTQDQAPKAVDVTLGARPGRTTVLHVLDVDSDPSGAILAVASVAAPDDPAARLQIAPDGQSVEITLPAAVLVSEIHFRYVVDDGKGLSAGATVTVQVRSPGQNAEPKLRTGFKPRMWTVPSGGHLEVPVLSDWRDFDGDPLVLTGASSAAGSAAVTPDGFVEYTAPAAGGTQNVDYQVSDGVGAPVGGSLQIRVQSPSSTSSLAPVAEPDVARGEVGQPIVVHPLDNDLPGADPTDPGAKLDLAQAVASPAGTAVSTDLADGTVTVTAARAGTYLLRYSDQFGSAPFSTATIRVDVAAAPGTPAPPVTVPAVAVLRGQQPATVDVLADDFDPSGAVLAVQQAAPVGADSGLQVAIVQGRWLRISALSSSRDPAPRLVDYTVTDGITGPVTGQVSVTQLPAPAQDAPIAVDDYASVRAGDTVSVPVLANDVDLAGAPLTLAADVPGAPGPGQLQVLAPSGTGGPANGSAFVTGDLVTFTAPASVPGAVTETVDYVAQNPAGDQATGHLRITVNPAPSAANPDRAPAPPPVQARTVAGDTVVIPISTSGVDPDGDSVSLTGIGSAPTLGRIVSMDATSLSYQAYPTSAGTDTFTYQVADRYGESGRNTVSVAVVPPGAPQPPVAVPDELTASPGAQVSVNVLADDVVAPGDTVSIEPLAALNPALPAGVSLAGPTGPIDVTAPGLTGKPVVVSYGITDGLGQPSITTLTVRSQSGFYNPPAALPTYVTPGAGQSTVTADVLAQCSDPDSASSGLAVSRVFDPAAKVVGGKVVLPVTSKPQTVAYEVHDAEGATTVGMIYVAAPGSGAPYAKPGVQIAVPRDGKATVALSTYVQDPAGKPVRLTTTNQIWASPAADLRADSSGDTTVELTARGGYTGPAALTFQVTDGKTLTDPAGHYAVVTIPVQVGAPTPVLRCPSAPVPVVEGGDTLGLDITSVCHVWVADPSTAASLRYTARWQGQSSGLTLGGSGSHTLAVAAAASATPGSTGTLVIGAAGTGAPAAQLSLVVTAAADPAVAPITVDGVKAGQTADINVTSYVSSQLRAPVISVVSASQSSGMAAAVSAHGASVQITPGAASHGTMTFAVTVSDVPQTGRTDQRATGQITLDVLGVPGAPGTPVPGGTVLSRSVQLSWTTPPDNGAPIESYQVSYNGGSQTCAASPCTITGLTNGTHYSFTAKARNLVGWSPPSGQSASAQPNAVPGAVTDLAATDPQNGTLHLAWTAAPDPGTPILDYAVTWSGGGSQTVQGTSMTATGLNNDVPDTFTVIAVNLKGPGPAATVSGESAGAPAAPQAPTFSADESADPASRTVKISWAPVDPNGPPSTTYTLTRTGDGTRVVCSGTEDTSCDDDGIANDGTIYTYTVTAANPDAATDAADHTSPPSPGTRMEATNTPGPIDNLSVSPTGVSGQATVDFDAPPSYGASSTVSCTYNGASCGSWSFPTGGSNGVSETVNGLPNGQDVTVSLQDCNGSQQLDQSGSPCDTAATADVTVYGPLSQPSISASANGQNVDFTVSVDPDGKAATVQVTTSRQSQTFTTGVGEFTWSGSDSMGYSATDTISVTVSDSGRGSQSNSTQVTTPPPPPPPPSVAVSQGPAGGCGGCSYIDVQLSNFTTSSISCSFDSNASGPPFVNETFTGNGLHQSYDYLGYSGDWVTATCNGVTSPQYIWP
jgi:large repetitive protein